MASGSTVSGGNATSRLPELFFAAGEEKTISKLPKGFGYRYKARDRWFLNHMIHNLTPKRDELYISYTIDFIPDTAQAAKSIKPVRPIWMDVENGSLYPVFDILQGHGQQGQVHLPGPSRRALPARAAEEQVDRGPRRRAGCDRRPRAHRRPVRPTCG